MRFLPLLLMLLFCSGCAHAYPVILDCTLPLYNDTGSCATAIGDTCKDLASISIYAQLLGRTDSVQVFTQNVIGQYGKHLICTMDRPEGTWDFWMVPQDSSGNRPKCRGTVVRRIISVSPSSGSMQ